MQRFNFTVNRSEAVRTAGFKHLLVVILASLLTALVSIAGMQFQTNISGVYFLFPLLILLVIFGMAVYALRQFGYRGSMVPLQSMMLLMAIGLLLQVRMHVSEQKSFTSNDAVQIMEETHSVVPMKHIRNQVAAYGLAVISVLLITMYARPFVLKWLSMKYMVLFASGLLLIGSLVLLVKLSGGGRFLAGMTPWEPVRIIIPVAMAGFFAHNGELFQPYREGKFRMPLTGWGPFLFMMCLLFGLFIILGDLGQLMIFFALTLALLYAASGSSFYPVLAMLLMISAVYSVQFITPFLPEYAAARIELWADFWSGFPSDAWWDRTYQTANALFAIQSGGVTGTGIGLGFPELVPLAVSDFVYAEIAEELGFIGSCAIILLYLSILLTGLHTANHSARRFEYLTVTALSLFLGLQVFINLGGVVNFIPLTGIALPFLSKGGFSVVTFASVIGVIMAVSHNNAIKSENLDKR